MSYFGQSVFNQSGALLGKRNYINKKLEEIKQRLINLGWYEEPPSETEEYYDEEYEYMPMDSAGALLPYRDKVNKTLDWYESLVEKYANYGYDNNYYDEYSYQPQSYQPQSYLPPEYTGRNERQTTNRNYFSTPQKQQEFKENTKEAVASLFDN